jgi:threonine/homoserine/homoserine lactone efflux protein|tara:strand:- start:819 stop:1424 length:606 start_codon:yes stop_codon:yes gene_type:complete
VISSSSTIEFLILQISVAFSPGLIIALIVNESVQKSRKNGLQVAAGAATGAIFITLITATVVAFVFNLIPGILTTIYIVGIIYIIYKGVKTIRAEIEIDAPEVTSESFKAGMKLNLLNPKMWVFYLSVLPIFVEGESSVFQSLIYLGTLTIGVNLVADITYAFLSSYFFGSSSLKSKKIINNVSGLCLILIGAYLLFSRFF